MEKGGYMLGAGRHRWQFCRLGGVDQVVLRDGADLAHLSELDLKLWMALCMPTRGIAVDPRTADLLDTDKDGNIRPPELLAALAWCESVFVDLGTLQQRTDSVALADIKDEMLLKGARRLLDNLGKPEAAVITLEDVSSQERIFANTRFNGDGILPPSSAGDPELERAIEDILRVCEGQADRSGKMGIAANTLDAFQRQAAVGMAWLRQPEADAETTMPLGREATIAAANALRPLIAKGDDFFTRCRLAAFDGRSTGALNRDASVYQALAEAELSASGEETAVLPLARIAPDAELPLDSGVNPAWASRVRTFAEKAVRPLLGQDLGTLGYAQWEQIKGKLAKCLAWQDARPPESVMALGDERLAELAAPERVAAIRALLQADSKLKEENAQIDKLEKMIRFHRDLYLVLTNYVNFTEFYGPDPAVFQAGTLYLDGRACHLCIDVTDPAKHAQLAGLSAAFLVYCDLRRPDGQQRSIVAVVTDGDSINLGLGRNGVFYDREGRDWSATISRMVSNPISIREAFWLPYRKFVKMIEDQMTKRAQAAEEASLAKMSNAATAVSTVDQKPATAVPATPPKIELGTIALIGTAIGGMSALVAGFLQALFGLGFWLPLGVLGVILLISGPSMILAAIKLKQRNLGPILDANGWAVNVRARMNPAFGASLTELAQLPPGAERTLVDPFVSKSRKWRRLLYVAIVAGVLALGWYWWQRLCRVEPDVPPDGLEEVATADSPADVEGQ
ncbi:MAG: hypothetical protein ACNA71_02950 [Kiritimatiellia bacterium]